MQSTKEKQRITGQAQDGPLFKGRGMGGVSKLKKQQQQNTPPQVNLKKLNLEGLTVRLGCPLALSKIQSFFLFGVTAKNAEKNHAGKPRGKTEQARSTHIIITCDQASLIFFVAVQRYA